MMKFKENYLYKFEDHKGHAITGKRVFLVQALPNNKMIDVYHFGEITTRCCSTAWGPVSEDIKEDFKIEEIGPINNYPEYLL